MKQCHLQQKMDLEIIILSQVKQTKKKIIWYHLFMESKKKRLIDLLTKWRLTDIENKLMVTKGDRTVGEEIN